VPFKSERKVSHPGGDLAGVPYVELRGKEV
jgi:hypothetical protein